MRSACDLTSQTTIEIQICRPNAEKSGIWFAFNSHVVPWIRTEALIRKHSFEMEFPFDFICYPSYINEWEHYHMRHQLLYFLPRLSMRGQRENIFSLFSLIVSTEYFQRSVVESVTKISATLSIPCLPSIHILNKMICQ